MLGSALVGVLCLASPNALSQRTADSADLLHVADQQRKAGNYKEAIDAYQQVLRLALNSGDADMQWNARGFLALTYKLAGNPQHALQLHEQNLVYVRQHLHELVDGPMNRELDSLQALAADYVSLGNLPKATELLNQALGIDERNRTDTGLLHAKLSQKLGIVQLLSDSPVQAEKTLSASLTAFETSRKARMAAGMPALGEYEYEVEVIRWLQKSVVAQGRTNAALELAEKGRSRAFAGLLAARLDPRSGSGPEETLTLSQMKAIAAAQRSELVVYSILYKYDPDLPLEFSDYTQIPATDLLIWLIRPTGEIAFRQEKLQPPLLMEELVRSARESIGARGRGVAVVAQSETKTRDASTELAKLQQVYQMLVQPIADLLPADPEARVTFIPQDLLFMVPFAALRDESGKYLVERHTLATAPSMQVLALTRKQQERLPEASESALVVGNPTMPRLKGEPLPNLPGTEEEAKAIAALLKAPVLIGAQATKQATLAQMPQARVIHFATHGLLDGNGGDFSALALAPADGDDGFLTAREILALKLDAELVVLSACDTGLGRITGDGVVGLSRALIGAGASSVLVSLWRVNDSATVSLMTGFYAALENGADKDQALRQAMLITMRQYPNPVDWAAFTLVGDATVSKTLRVAMASGMGGGKESDSRAATAARRYKVFPVPAGVEDYKEWPSAAGEVGITFDTTLTLQELMRFYRRAFARDGLQEDTNLTSLDKKGFSIVFNGSPNGRLVVQGTDMSDLGTDERTISVRFER